MSFSQLVAICIGDNADGKYPSKEVESSSKRRCAEALERFEEAVNQSRDIQKKVSVSRQLLSDSCTHVSECLECPRRQRAMSRLEFYEKGA